MLCERCQEREANVFTTTIIDGVPTGKNLCEQCWETHYPEEFAMAKAKMEAGCRYCGAKCGMPICERCLAEMQRVVKEKGIDCKKHSLSEKENRADSEGWSQVVAHMFKWAGRPRDDLSDLIDILALGDAPFAALVESDSRFTIQAYQFVAVAARGAGRESGQVSGRELALAVRAMALEAHGTNALKMLVSWGIFTTDDIGTIVFQLLEAGLLEVRVEGTIEDFHAVYDFATAFPEEASER